MDARNIVKTANAVKTIRDNRGFGKVTAYVFYSGNHCVTIQSDRTVKVRECAGQIDSYSGDILAAKAEALAFLL